MADTKDENKYDIFESFDMKQPEKSIGSLLALFMDKYAGITPDNNPQTLYNFNEKFTDLLSLLSTDDRYCILNTCYKTPNDKEITPLKACLIGMNSFSQNAYAYNDRQQIFNEYWRLLVLFCNYGSNPAITQDKFDYNDDEYSFETLCNYLLTSLYNLMSNETEIVNRYMFIMTFGTEKNLKKQSHFDPAIYSMEYVKYCTSSNININITLCGGAFISPLDGFNTGDKLKQLQSPLTIYQLLQNGYVLMENNSYDHKVSTIINELFINNKKNNKDLEWISYGYNSIFILYLWILKNIYKEFRNGYQHLLNQCYITMRQKQFKGDELSFDIFFCIMDFAIGDFAILLNEIDDEFFCTNCMKYFPSIPKKFQFWCINFILNKLSDKNLEILKESTKNYSDKWPKLFSTRYGNNKSDRNILLYLLKLYKGEFINGRNANDFRVLLKRQCENDEIIELLMSNKLQKLMINKRLLVELWMDNNLSEKSLIIILDAIYNTINNNDTYDEDKLGLSATLTSAFGVICSDKLVNANSKHCIWHRLCIILSNKYENRNKWIDLSEILDKIFENNQMIQFLINKQLLNIDDCFKNVYKLKRALLQKRDDEYYILKIILNYLMENGQTYKEQLKLICIENEKIAMNIQNKPRCSQCFKTCVSVL